MTSIMPAICRACTRLTPMSDPNTGTATVARCHAYPDGIPTEIALGADHREARGDERNGLLFRQAETPEGRTAFDAWKQTFGDA